MSEFEAIGESSRAQGRAHLSPVHWLFGLLSLALRSGGELTRVVGEMHHTWSEAPMPWDKTHQADIQRAPKTYLLIKMLLESSATQLHRILDRVPATERVSQPLYRVRSAMNGVFGDKLNEWEHPLALPMETVDEQGGEVALSRLQAESAQGVVLFIHGLCLSEGDWQGPDHQAFVTGLRQQGYAVAWLRYNTGLPIWENGSRLDQLLSQQWKPAHDKRLVMIGHSMGGLIIRSACHAASQSRGAWLSALTHAAYLASPHDGAPMEKIGNLANSLLGVTPYARPLMALGNIRSLGIRSLRYANVTPPQDASQRQQPLPMYEGCQHLLLGARKFYEPGQRWLGDGLVPEASAMGGEHFPLSHTQVRREMLDDVGHITLLQDPRLYRLLCNWLSENRHQG
ncbi:MAG: alpha/beta fold hydrolase [Pseudomonadota bacterium]|nr:alpha/beta fold hydrolase [Pseudomonadota bacterium]